jgi:hypothetical protein
MIQKSKSRQLVTSRDEISTLETEFDAFAVQFNYSDSHFDDLSMGGSTPRIYLLHIEVDQISKHKPFRK